MKNVPQTPRHAQVEPLECRRLFTAIPYSQSLADQLVADISPANNTYTYNTPVVTWAGLNGATSYSNASDCSNFETLLLMQAYGFTASQFTKWTGYSLPQAKDYYNAAAADDGFTGFTQIADVQVGDAMFIKYLDPTTDTGHVVTIDQLPVLTSTTATERLYNLTVVDCTADPHSNDTRSGTESGVGRGTMRLYTDLSGNLIAYSWGLSNQSVIETASVRPAIFAKLPAASTNTFLAAGSQATWNSSNDTLVVTGPTTIIADPGSSQQPAVTETGSAAQLLMMPGINSIIHLASLTLTGGATATVYDPNAGSRLLDIAANVGDGVVSVDTASQLNLGSNDLIVHGGNLTNISSLIARGYNRAAGGNWLGMGVTSSSAATDSTHLTALGAILNSTNGTTAIYSSFDGVSAAAADVLVRHTYYGDTNLDGKVDGSDYARIDNGMLHRTSLSGWYNGDFNYDGSIDGSDYALIDNSFNTQGASLAAQIAVPPAPAARVAAAVFSQMPVTAQASGPRNSSNTMPDNIAAEIFAANGDGLRMSGKKRMALQISGS